MNEEIETSYLVDPVAEFDPESIVNKFRDFRDRSKRKFADNYDKMRKDRDFLNGETQWTTADGRHVSSKRNRMLLNVMGNSCNAVVNQYSLYGFSPYTGNPDDDRMLDTLQKRGSNGVCDSEALKNSVSLGLGVMAMGTDKQGVPCVYAINDFDRCILDPESQDLDGEDMVEGALIDYRGKRWVELNYGPEFVPGDREKNIVQCPRDLVPIITYFVLEEEGCHVYTLVNNQAIDGGLLPLDRIPIVPVYGERWFDNEGDLHWGGIVNKARAIQKLVNLSVTQLAERLSLSRSRSGWEPSRHSRDSISIIRMPEQGITRFFRTTGNPPTRRKRSNLRSASTTLSSTRTCQV